MNEKLTELDSRIKDGLVVRLLWSEAARDFYIEKDGELYPVSGDEALEAFDNA